MTAQDFEPRPVDNGPRLTARDINGDFLQRPEADPQDLRAHPRGRSDAEPDRGAAELLRSFPADGGSAGAARQCRAAGSLQVGLPDPRFLRARPARIRPLRAGDAEIRRRRVPAARHHLRRAAEGDAAPRRLGCRRGHRLALDPRHQGAGRLYGRHAVDDAQRHVHHQRHRAGHRLADAPQPRRVLRPRQGQDAFLGQIPVRRAGHPLSRLLARFRVRRQGPRLCPHRPAPQAAGDDAAAGARRRRDRGEAGAAPGREQDAAARRGHRHVEGGDPLRLLRHDHLPARRPAAG